MCIRDSTQGLGRSAIAMEGWALLATAALFDSTITVFIEGHARFTHTTDFFGVWHPAATWPPNALIDIAIKVVIDLVADFSCALGCRHGASLVDSTVTVAIDVVAADLFARKNIADAGFHPTVVVAIHDTTTTDPYPEGRR